jgi:hypothetical protein
MRQKATDSYMAFTWRGVGQEPTRAKHAGTRTEGRWRLGGGAHCLCAALIPTSSPFESQLSAYFAIKPHTEARSERRVQWVRKAYLAAIATSARRRSGFGQCFSSFLPCNFFAPRRANWKQLGTSNIIGSDWPQRELRIIIRKPNMGNKRAITERLPALRLARLQSTPGHTRGYLASELLLLLKTMQAPTCPFCGLHTSSFAGHGYRSSGCALPK